MDAVKRLLILLPLLIASCALLQEKKPVFFSPAEQAILEKTTHALDYGFGYDAEVDLSYVFVFSSGEMSPDRREKEFAAVIKNISAAEMLGFFDEMYRLNSMTRYKLNKYKRTRKWKYYTYLQNYLLPPLDTYCSLIQKYLLTKSPELEDGLSKRKARIDKNVARYYYELEMEELRKDFYY